MKKFYLLLLGILILATTLRVYQLDKVPVELFGDELDVGYQAYSILKTGSDIYNQHLPVFIHSLAEYRAPLFIYSAVPGVAIFGLNEWGVRIPAVFWGVISIIGLFFLTKELFNERVALIAALFLAISPWHIHYSRAAFEVTMLLGFLIFATLFFIKGLKNSWYLFLAITLFALTPYIYSTAIVFMPLLLLILIFLNKNTLRKNYRLLLSGAIIFLIILLPYGINTFSGKTGERFNSISIFAEKSLQEKVLIAQQTESLPLHLERLLHNKPLIYGQYFAMNYLRAFSPEFLFLNGDPNFRQSVHEMGVMYIYEIVPLLLGIWLLIKRSRESLLVLGWLLLAPLPAALTYDGGFHATRNFLMLVPLSILVAHGLTYLLERKNKLGKCLFILVLIMGIFNVIFFLNRYFYNYPKESWRAWNYGFKESLQYVADNQNSYNRIFINNSYEPSLERFLFWTKYDPAKFHQEFSGDKTIKNITAGFNGFQLENRYYFGSFNEPFENILKNNELFVASSREDLTNPEIIVSGNLKLQKIVRSPSGEVILYLVKGTK
ncbi:MAG: glycosyltransferase family 39 protein [Candidatus Daviesbacteria bacterium]|nr:glycosyltransferase family 39 protein [Candidatus Daviesbacteria bacterium]